MAFSVKRSAKITGKIGFTTTSREIIHLHHEKKFIRAWASGFGRWRQTSQFSPGRQPGKLLYF
jgi:hypothetical protein